MRNFPYWILLWTTLGGAPAFAANMRNNTVAEIENACTAKETWRVGNWIPPKYRSKMSNPPKSRSDALDLLAASFRLKMTTRSPELRVLADYYIYRAYFELKLFHFAQRGFNALLDPKSPAPPLTANLTEVAVASAACLNQMRRNYPSMTLAAGIINSLKNIQVSSLTPNQKASFWIDASKRGVDAETLEHSQKLLRMQLPETIKAQVDAIHLNLARVYYNYHEYNKAIKEFDKVSKQSNLFTAALEDKAWAFLLQKKYSEASGASYGFRVGALKGLFAPDAPIILAISYYENCHFKEALESVQHFKKKYAKTYRTLYDWYYQQRKAPIDYYALITQFIEGKRKVLPKDLATEWIRSPRFISQQQEVNLLFDENETARKLEKDISNRIEDANKEDRVFLSNLKGALVSLIRSIPDSQRNLVTRINTELLWRNYNMIIAFVDAFENSQLIEVEVLRALGDHVLDKTGRPDYEELAKKSIYKKNPNDLVPVLDWGNFSADENDNPELWEDEVGAFKLDVSNICPKK
jgi:hypothetical protein